MEALMKKRYVFFAVLLFFFIADSAAADLNVSKISNETLLKILDSKYSEHASIDEDGDIKIEANGLKIFIEIDEERNFLKFYSGWKKSDTISDNRLFKILNEWNKTTVFTTVFNDGEVILINYFLCMDGGINSENFNGTLSWLFSIAHAFDDYLNEEDAL